MRRSRRLLLVLAGMIGAGWPGVLAAQSRAAVVSLQYESPTLAVPIAVVALHSDEGREWTLGVVGWTLGADWRQVDRPTRRRHLFVHVTPFNANRMNAFSVLEIDRLHSGNVVNESAFSASFCICSLVSMASP